jgi:phosphoenolpyruvate-protein phosphotransferase (PTS system enzyme I)
MKNNTATQEIVLTGLGVSHGIAMGPAYFVQIEHPEVPHYQLVPEQIVEEIARFDAAVRHAQIEIAELGEKSTDLPPAAAEEISFLLEAHQAMLSGSRLIRGVRQRITEGVNAEAATVFEVTAIAEQFRQLKDPYIAGRSDDVKSVGYRLIRILMNIPYLSLGDVPPGGIVMALSMADPRVIRPLWRAASACLLYWVSAPHCLKMRIRQGRWP